MELTEQIPFTLAHGPKFIERYERGEYDEEMMGFLETKLSEWDLMYRVRAAGCEDIEEYAKALMAEEEKNTKYSVVQRLLDK